MSWRTKTALVLLAVLAYFAAVYALLGVIAPLQQRRPAAAAGKPAPAASATVSLAVARGEAAALDVTYEIAATAGGWITPGVGGAELRRDLVWIRAAYSRAGGAKAGAGGTAVASAAPARKGRSRGGKKGAAAPGLSPAAAAALRDFAAVATQAEGELGDRAALRALLPRLRAADAALLGALGAGKP